jgi:pimeloyl-ACP methyl ester carboxylesterase
MVTTTVPRATTTSVNGAALYCEVRGNGPPVLLISGATGDSGHWEQVAERLSDDFTVISYDRRGNSRSPRPVDWNRTSVEEQADDAAGLLRTLGLAPATALGTSSGAVILLNLLLRHPDVLRGALVHEPPLIPVLANPRLMMVPVQAAIEAGMTAGGPCRALEAFLRFAAGDAVYERLNADLRERMLGNTETFFGIEFGRLEEYVPNEAVLAAVKLPARVLVSRESAPFFREVCTWLVTRTGWALREIPGAHAPYLDRPDETAEALRPLLRECA